MKKTLAVLLVLTLGFCALCLPASAATTLSLTVGSASGMVNRRVEVPVKLEGNSGIICVNAILTFDTDKLQLVSVKNGGLVGKANHQDKLTSPYEISFSDYTAKEPFTEDGTLCTLVFFIRDGAAGDVIDVALEVEQYGVMNMDLNSITPVIQNGSVTVTGVASPMWIWYVSIGGGVLVLALIGAGVFLFLRRKKASKKENAV